MVNQSAHELAHASHLSNTNIFHRTDDIIIESWACYAQKKLTIEDYKEWTGENPFTTPYIYHHMNRPWVFEYADWLNKQAWTLGGGDYSPLFIDMKYLLIFTLTFLCSCNRTVDYWPDYVYSFYNNSEYIIDIKTRRILFMVKFRSVGCFLPFSTYII